MAELARPSEFVPDDLEHCELLDGRLVLKASVGRKKHSQLELIVLAMLQPFARAIGSTVAHEWTMLNGLDKVIPDVAFSFPNHEEVDGYLVAPAFLVVEAASQDQSLSSLFKKCRDRYHRFGTPYCWILDADEEVGYECHKRDGDLFRIVDTLTAGPDIRIVVNDIFSELKKLP